MVCVLKKCSWKLEREERERVIKKINWSDVLDDVYTEILRDSDDVIDDDDNTPASQKFTRTHI